MANTVTQDEASFWAGRMNKDFDERLIPKGEYIDALNVRVLTSEGDNEGALENAKGNTKLTNIRYSGESLSENAKCIGVFEDGVNETIYWFVCDPGNDDDLTKKDMLLSFNTSNGVIKYHLVSYNVLNFSKDYLINGINKVDNLLFWTDNLNPPRKINIERDYGSFTEEDISVIVAPPMSAPTISYTTVDTESNYTINKFVSFAYRYRYKDNEYSALSQFSDIAFEPGAFQLDYTSYTNKSMNSIYNAINIGINTGSKNVIGIDLCFKLSDSNIINVVEKFDREDQGWVFDNTVQTVLFTNKKIYTTLQESELYRLYDNVPRKAKTQTVMGNRIMYGNYVDGYDVDINPDYNVELISEDVGFKEVATALTSGVNYTIGTTQTIVNSNINIDLTDYKDSLDLGSYLSINFQIVHNSNTGLTGSALLNNSFTYNFLFTLRRKYTSVYDLASSDEFQLAIYNSTIIYNNCSSGSSLTDIFRCNISPSTGSPVYDDIDSGITALNQGFSITTSLSSNIIGIQIPAVKFRAEYPTGTYLYAYEYFNYGTTNVEFSKPGSRRSLHSNRDYELGIVYMDKYLRSSTALIDTNNTIKVDAQYSSKKNNIRAYISSKAPSWAKKYKFVLNPAQTNYETIYSKTFFKDDLGNTWIKLDGENRSKVKEGSVLIVKSDTNGVLDNLVKTSALSLETKANNFISTTTTDTKIKEPAGLYMKVHASDFSVDKQDDSTINSEGSNIGFYSIRYKECDLSMSNPDTTSGATPYIPYDIPAGSTVYINIEFNRNYRGKKCGQYKYTYEKEFVASKDYNNFYDFYLGDNINFGDGVWQTKYETPFPVKPATYANSFSVPHLIDYEHHFYFQKDATTGKMRLVIASGTPDCNPSYSFINIITNRATDLLVFETEPELSNGEIYFENSQSFDIVNGYHQSGSNLVDVNQTSSVDAVVNLDFFNCFSFGNGVESYKINDSLTGSPMYIGSRVTSVSAQDYKEANRYADITYSGIYNSDTNINRLNEFNLGLSNWKNLEQSFGPINKLHSRKTDLLVLQEDKISTLQQGVNLLSDAGGGGVVTFAPEVLGKQIARLEECGISDDASSFAYFGADVYFTDTKRGGVVNIKGDELSAISRLGMNNWFRSELKDRLKYQKIGGYDPYMNEYVLSLNNNKKEEPIPTYQCGTDISKTNLTSPFTFNLELGEIIGKFDLGLAVYDTINSIVNLSVSYNGTILYNGNIVDSVITDLDKNSVYPSYAVVTISPIVDEEVASFNMYTTCVKSNLLTVIKVVVNSPDSSLSLNVDRTIHNKNYWSKNSFTSPKDIDYIKLNNDGISLFETHDSYESHGTCPANGSVVTMESAKIGTDTFEFKNNRFYWLLINTLYTEEDINTLVAQGKVTNLLTPTLINGSYKATFTYANNNGYKYLYLIWDYRDIINGKIWSTKNLDVTTYRDGTPIPQVNSALDFNGLTTGAWCWYNNDSSNNNLYGKLYNFYAVAGIDGSGTIRKLAPLGYSIPTESDINSLSTYYGGNTLSGGHLKAVDGFFNPNTGADNTSGFYAVAGGGRLNSTGDTLVTKNGYYWTSTSVDSTNSKSFSMAYDSTALTVATSPNKYGMSARVLESSGIATVITSSPVTDILNTTATCGGTALTDGDSTITARGIVWSTSINPTIILTTKTVNGSGIGPFISNMTGLYGNTTYYVRAYVTNGTSTYYGSNVSFTTQSFPTITTTVISEITAISAVSGGTILNDGSGSSGNPLYKKGVCWSTSIDPTIALSTKTVDGSGSSPFTSNITGLTPSTTYYVRAYATNNIGTSYGSNVSFTTIADLIAPNIGQLSTSVFASDNTGKAILNWTAASDNVGVIGYKVYMANPTVTGGSIPDVYNLIATLGNVLTYTKTNLESNMHWFKITAFDANGNISEYSNVVSPTCIVPLSISISGSSLDIKRTLTITGGLPPFNIYKTLNSEDTSNVMNLQLDNTDYNPLITINRSVEISAIWDNSALSGESKYYIITVQSSDINDENSVNKTIMITKGASPPVLDISSISSVTATSAVSVGLISTDNGYAITSKGVCWSTSIDPTIALSTKTNEGPGNTVTFISNITGLTPLTTYYARTYATNSIGTSYGENMIFTTQSGPFVKTSEISSISEISAVSGGTVLNDSGNLTISKGVCWSTSIDPTIALSTKTVDGSGPSSFTSSITGLAQGTTYYVRAYVTSSSATYYGSNISFTTYYTPSISTSGMSNIESTSATSGGAIISDGGNDVITKGVCWSTSTNPTIALSTKTVNGSGSSSFTSNITGLTPLTTYYVRAYATNSTSTYYGSNVSFTTQSTPIVTKSILSTSVFESDNTEKAILNWTAATSNVAISGYRVYMANPTTPGGSIPDVYNLIVTLGNVLTYTKTNLESNMHWFKITAFDANGLVSEYSNIVNPICYKPISISISGIDTDIERTLTITGGLPPFSIYKTYNSYYSELYSSLNLQLNHTDDNPIGTINSNVSISAIWPDGSITGEHASYTITVDSSDDQELINKTIGIKKGASPPVLGVSGISGVTAISATSIGEISSDNGQVITSKGVCWSTSIDPTIALSTKTVDGSGNTRFTSNITGLTPLTTYYARTYATNSIGTSYGENMIFTTQSASVVTIGVLSTLSGQSNNNKKAVLNWTAATSGIGVAGYKVYMANPTVPGGSIPGTYNLIATLGNVLTYTKTNLESNIHWFNIIAFDTNGLLSEFSNVVSPTCYEAISMSIIGADTDVERTLTITGGLPPFSIYKTFVSQSGSSSMNLQLDYTNDNPLTTIYRYVDISAIWANGAKSGEFKKYTITVRSSDNQTPVEKTIVIKK